MSVSTYLYSLSSELIITESERIAINGYTDTVKTRLSQHFQTGLIVEQFSFGSFTRKTLMPKKADSESDVDYMVVFNPNKPTLGFYGGMTYTYYEPSTYLNWIKGFVEGKYPRSEIFQSHPTIVLQLSKFKIEIVPAKKDSNDTYEIPAPLSDYTKWLVTNPNSFNEIVRKKNTAENSKIRPVIRVMKYWNAQNGYIYSSYDLEQKIVNTYYYNCTTVWDYLRTFVSNISTVYLGITATSKVDRLKKICENAYNYESSYWSPNPALAEAEIKKAFPVFKL
ncbi:MAG: nucleotidyltransferase [Spirosoma sp.]|nr:nucleotidyltransferase [Spirosoma sp.]